MLLIAYLVLKMIIFSGKQQRENTNQENDFCVENPFGTVYLGTFFQKGFLLSKHNSVFASQTMSLQRMKQWSWSVHVDLDEQYQL